MEHEWMDGTTVMEHNAHARFLKETCKFKIFIATSFQHGT